MIPVLVLAAVTAFASSPASAPASTPRETVSAISCDRKVVHTSRWLEVGAQLVNTLIVSNAVRHGSQARMLAGGSVIGLAAQYAAIDFATDQLDRQASCKVRAAINAFFGLGAIYNASKAEFPK